jgi:hypothetical protein
MDRVWDRSSLRTWALPAAIGRVPMTGLWLVGPGLLAAFAMASSAQTPQQVIDEYLRARGGAKALAQIRTEIIAGSLSEEATGNTGSYSAIAQAPDRFYSEIIAGPDRVVAAYNGRSAWGQDSPESARTLTGDAAREAEAEGRYGNSRLADGKKARLSLQLLGIEKVRGRDASHIQILLGAGLTREVFFDTQTHLVVREILPEPARQFDYDDYRPVQGIQTPYRIELRRGGHLYRISVTRAEFNSPVDGSVFDFPRTAQTPVPDIAALILEVTRNQKAVEEMQKQYTCHLTTEEEKTDSKGRATSKTIREFEVFNIAGEEVRHLVAKDGKPLGGDEKRKEDERFNKQFARLTKKEAEPGDPKKQAKQEAKEEAQISDFLRAVRFSNSRRERFRGEPVIAVDFGPNPDYKPRKAIEGIVQKLAGVIWIDEQARDVARLEAHFTNSAKIGGGLLASLDKGSSFVFEQAKVNNEVWLPTYDEVHVAGRLLVVKLKANQVDRYTDYRKFHAESKIIGVED